MALFRCDVFSKTLEMYTTLNVVIPDHLTQEERKGIKVLYLLHGLSDNSSAWLRNTSIERYACDFKVAVVMPEVQRSFYTDMEYGLPYFTYVSKELPELANKFFGLPTCRERSFVAGLSMGGYGALKVALSCPESYAGGAGFSGVLDMTEVVSDEWIQRLKEEQPMMERELIGIMGSEIKLKDSNDLFKLASSVNKLPKSDKPSIYVTCGTEDFLYAHNTKFRDHMNTLDYDFEYHDWKGDHTWDFWDKSIVMAMEFFFKKDV